MNLIIFFFSYFNPLTHGLGTMNINALWPRLPPPPPPPSPPPPSIYYIFLLSKFVFQPMVTLTSFIGHINFSNSPMDQLAPILTLDGRKSKFPIFVLVFFSDLVLLFVCLLLFHYLVSIILCCTIRFLMNNTVHSFVLVPSSSYFAENWLLK